MAQDFWRHSGFHLLRRDASGRLVVSDDFLRADIAGRPVYLALSMGEDGVVRMKPQNLLTNLPLAQAS